MDLAVTAISGAAEVALACHVTPDGDALGSTLALHLALRAAGRRSIASFPEPFVVGPHYRYLPGLDTLTPPDRFPVVEVPPVALLHPSDGLGVGDLIAADRGRLAGREAHVVGLLERG